MNDLARAFAISCLTAPLASPAVAGDLKLICSGTILAVPNTPPAPFAGVQAGDPVSVTIEVLEPPTSPVGFLALYTVDYGAGGLQVGTAFEGFDAGSAQPGCTVQNDGPLGAGDLLGFSGDGAGGNGGVLVSISDPSGVLFSSTDLRSMIGAMNVPSNITATIGYGAAAGPFFGASLDVFVVEDSTGGGTPFCSAAANSTGLAGVLDGVGSTQVADNNLTLVASQLPTNQFGFLINSLSQAFVQGPGGSQGNLCLGSPIGRHNQTIGNSGATGVILVPIDLTALPRPTGGPAQVLVGDTWNFQLWYRDLNPGAASNFTQGYSVTFR